MFHNPLFTFLISLITCDKITKNTNVWHTLMVKTTSNKIQFEPDLKNNPLCDCQGRNYVIFQDEYGAAILTLAFYSFIDCNNIRT